MTSLSHEAINYLEFQTHDIDASKTFFSQVFDWSFTDYGPDYSSFSGAGIDGGFFNNEQPLDRTNPSVLVVFYSKQLEHTQTKIEQAGGQIIKPIFSFPGGRRFHFQEPGGNELAVWSDKTPA